MAALFPSQSETSTDTPSPPLQGAASKEHENSLCLRCPTSLNRARDSSSSLFCGSCRAYFYYQNKQLRLQDPPVSPMSEEEFLDRYPSAYKKEKRLCIRCPATLNRLSHASKLCRSCYSGFYCWRGKNVKSDGSQPTPEEFVAACPSRFAKRFCKRCSADFKRVVTSRSNCFCRLCLRLFHRFKQEEKLAGRNEPSAEEFIQRHPVVL